MVNFCESDPRTSKIEFDFCRAPSMIDKGHKKEPVLTKSWFGSVPL